MVLGQPLGILSYVLLRELSYHSFISVIVNSSMTASNVFYEGDNILRTKRFRPLTTPSITVYYSQNYEELKVMSSLIHISIIRQFLFQTKTKLVYMNNFKVLVER